MKTTVQQIKPVIESFALSSGNPSGDIEIDCCLWGNPEKPVVVLMGGISANRWVQDHESHAGWWQAVVNDEGVLNTQDFCFLTFEYLCIEATDAVSNPLVTTQDQATLLGSLQQKLNLAQFHAVIGSSYGGMVALAFATSYPQALRHLICIAAADQNSVKSQALRLIQRQIMALGQQTLNRADQQQFTALARSLAMVGYRGEGEWEKRFQSIKPGQSLTQISGYLEHHGQQFANRFCQHRYAQLSQSIDYHQVDVRCIQASTLLIGFTTDQMVPVDLIKRLRNKLTTDCQLHLISSTYGHDGFLLEVDALNQIFNRFFSEQPHDNFERNNRRASGY